MNSIKRVLICYFITLF